VTVTVKNDKELTVPRSIQRPAGIKSGDRLEFRGAGGVINIRHKPASAKPAATGEYMPAQRRKIDAQLLEARKGPFHGPFDSADEMIAHIERELTNRSADRKTNKRSR